MSKFKCCSLAVDEYNLIAQFFFPISVFKNDFIIRFNWMIERFQTPVAHQSGYSRDVKFGFNERFMLIEIYIDFEITPRNQGISKLAEK